MVTYFFSRHEAAPEMIQHLGGIIDYQFRGTISGIRRVGDVIQIVENLNYTDNHYDIPANSTVVVVGPTSLQLSWLAAGVGRLLVPQTEREVDALGVVTFRYTGLLWVKEIQVVSEQFAGHAPTSERKAAERKALINYTRC